MGVEHLGIPETAGGLCDELCRSPINPDLIPRPDGQGSWWKSYSDQMLFRGSLPLKMGQILPEPQGVEVGLTLLWSTEEELCQPKLSWRIQFTP